MKTVKAVLVVGLVLMLGACQSAQGQLERFGWLGDNPYQAGGAAERAGPSRAEMAMQPLPLRDEMNSSNDISSFPVSCQIEKGEARMQQGFAKYRPVQFMVPALGAVRIPLQGRGARAELQAEVDETGQQIVFCPVIAAGESKRSCAAIYALPDDFKMGFRRNFNIEGSLHGAVLTCRS
jgi:hypothetical protein